MGSGSGALSMRGTNLHYYTILSHDIASVNEIMPCNKIHKPLVVFRFSGNVMTSITMFRHNDKIITFLHHMLSYCHMINRI